MDVLTDMLQRSRARGAAFSRSRMHGRWGLQFPVNGALAVHAVVEGDLCAWTHEDPEHPVRVTGGDVLLLRASPHFVASDPGVPTRPFAEVLGLGPVSRLAEVGTEADGPSTEFCCGAYLFDGDLSKPLLDSLPGLVRVRPPRGSTLRATVDLLSTELDHEGPGQQALLDRLLDVTLVQCLRVWFAGQPDRAPGWFRAMDDPSLGAALQAVHSAPAHPWTVGDLAALANQSRSSFASRFTEVVGASPVQYLTDWRMALAKEQLRDSDDGLWAIATSVGYSSEFSFAAAFKRHVGLPPGRWRATARAGPRARSRASALRDADLYRSGGLADL